MVLRVRDRQPREPGNRVLGVRLAVHELHLERRREVLDRVPVVRLLQRDDVGVLLAEHALDRVDAILTAVPDVPGDEPQPRTALMTAAPAGRPARVAVNWNFTFFGAKTKSTKYRFGARNVTDARALDDG